MNDRLILTIIDKFSNESIGELELDDGTSRLKLRKEWKISPQENAISTAGESIITAGIEQRENSIRPGENSVRLGISANKAEASGEGEKITSPIVATYYSAPSPDTPPYVKPGSKVKAGETLCILEAMKMMNHLEAEYNCQILEVNAVNGDLVEYGQTLFSVIRL